MSSTISQVFQKPGEQKSGLYGGRLSHSEQVMTLFIAALIGVLAAFGALIFRGMILGTEIIFWRTSNLTAEAFKGIPWYWKMLAPAVGGLLLAPIVVRWASAARGSGVPEVIESAAVHGGMVPRRIVPLKAIAAALCIGSGGSAGREGPIVHIGAAIGSWIAQYLKCSVKQTRTFMGCGVAGGIAATFNTPFAGALFAVEVVLGDFGTAKISPIVIASIVATVVSRHYAGDFPHIDVPDFSSQVPVLTLLLCLAIGIGSGGVSALFIKMMHWGWSLANRWRYSPYLLPAAGGLLVGVIGIFFPQVFGVGYDTINEVLLNRLDIWLVFVLVVLKLLATSATLTSGGSGGIFAPSLFIGALLGGLFGYGVQWMLPAMDLSTTIFVLVGMGAMVAGTTRAPISAILVIFELTYEPTVIVPLMAACIPSVLISAWFHGDSIYIAKLTHKGVRLKKKNELNLLKGMQVIDVMESRVTAVSPNTTLMEMVERFFQSTFPIMWMVNEKGKLLGVLESRNLEFAMLEKESLMALVTASDVATPISSVVYADDDLSLAMNLFSQSDFEILAVLDRKTELLLGDVMRSDIMRAYNQELSVRDSLGVTMDAIGTAERLGMVDIGDGYSLLEFEVPYHLTGKTLAELDLRKKAEAQVILVKRHGKQIVPGPKTELKIGDVLLLAGRADLIEEKIRKV
jgi:chloride channel protein, CIC family